MSASPAPQEFVIEKDTTTTNAVIVGVQSEYCYMNLSNYTSLWASKCKVDLAVKTQNCVYEESSDILGPFKYHLSYDKIQCLKCGNKPDFVNGVRQYVEAGVTTWFPYPDGWIECKNQFRCATCDMYIIHEQRMYIHNYNGYSRLTMCLSDPIVPLKEKETKWRKPRPVYKSVHIGPNSWNYDNFYWDGKCFICKEETVTIKDHGCVGGTGAFSLFNDSICPNCFMYYHSEEHDD